MNKGMLWYDNNSKAPLSQRILQAVQYYQSKYGQSPTYCLIHPAVLKVEQDLSNHQMPVIVKAAPYVLPNHFWLGIEEGN